MEELIREFPLFWWKNNPLIGIKVNFFQKWIARLLGGCYVGKHQPEGFLSPTRFWLAYDRKNKKFYVYYEHGFPRHSNMITNFMLPPWELEKKIYWQR